MDLETRYPRPRPDLLDALVADACTGAGERAFSGEPTWIEFGSNTLVALGDRIALRIARTPAASAGLLRTQALVDALPSLPFAVPASLGDPVTLEGHVAIPTRRLDGEPHPAHSGEPGPLRALLEAIHAVDPAPLRPHLAQPRAFMGGAGWEGVLRERVVPLLSEDLRDEARRRIDALVGLAPPAVVVNHGDLAGSNVLWRDGRVSGVLDWDLTAVEDPAEDLASLASWHGWALAPELADPATVARAEVFRRSFGLQQIAFTIVTERPADVRERVLARVEQRLRG